ncbi:MAG: TfoX/Sxy family protein [Chloroflexi bacterium]|nr:TfoX/Sxy family protein [Chloroflexota bacterium]
MAYDEGLAQRVREVISERPFYQEKKMFGGIGFLIQGNMACGVIREDLIVRVGAEKYTDSLLKPNVELFDMTGRAMTGWVVVKEPGYRKDEDLQNWVDQGLQYVLTLPAK